MKQKLNGVKNEGAKVLFCELWYIYRQSLNMSWLMQQSALAAAGPCWDGRRSPSPRPGFRQINCFLSAATLLFPFHITDP